MQRGTCPGGFEWLEARQAPWGLQVQLKRAFHGRWLLLACIDSGPILPSAEEIELGWRSVAAGMLSPPLYEGLAIPSQQYEEWWIFENAPQAEALPEYEYFVNHGRWSLKSPAEIEESFDATWEKDSLVWLRELQSRFWGMVSTFEPLAYIADGDNFILASRDSALIESLARSDV